MKKLSLHKQKTSATHFKFLPSLQALLTSVLVLLFFTAGTAQVVISEIFAAGTFELKNNGNTTVNLSNYWICTFPSYNRLSDLNIECGDLNLAANETVTLSGFDRYDNNDDELGLYNSNNFSSPAAIEAYIRLGCCY